MTMIKIFTICIQRIMLSNWSLNIGLRTGKNKNNNEFELNKIFNFREWYTELQNKWVRIDKFNT